jgi:hypothetical protein
VSGQERYATPAAVESAIAAAARNTSRSNPALTTSERIRLEYFNRFLSRVFSEGHVSGWILKGGTGMLARVASARATIDVDLTRSGHSLDAALSELRRLAETDLGDFFRFDYTGYVPSIGGDQQAYVDGYRVSFDVSIGASRKGQLHVDLVSNVITTDDPESASPANALDLPKLANHPYRLYSVVDQIADKVCATLSLYNGRRSSREKDLVDLVVLAVTQDIDGAKLTTALQVEARMRSLDLPHTFHVPPHWGANYAKLAKSVPACEQFRTIGDAQSLVRSLIEPALEGSAAGRVWNRATLKWS